MLIWKKKRIYADAAAATPLSPGAKAELLRLLDVYGNAGALHKEALRAKDEMDVARATIAESIGAHPDEIVFTASGTEANNLAIEGVLRPLLRAHVGGAPVHAITCAIEHQSVLEPLRALEAEGLALTVLPVDGEGFVSAGDLVDAMRPTTAFISIQLVNSEVGTIEPVRDLAKRARKAAATEVALYFHTDASQAPLWLPLAVEKLGVDLLTLDAQKVQGPKGVGALYVRRKTHLAPLVRGGVQEFSLRAGTPNTPQVGSFAVALRDAQEGVAVRTPAIADVRNYLWREIQAQVPGAALNGPGLGEGRVANNLNLSIPGLDAEMAVLALDAEGVAASTRSACNTGDEDPSHVIKALGVPKDLAKTAIRLTLLPGATKGEAARIAAALAAVAKRYRSVVK